jgi:ABC-2 type transport system permease protein
MSDCRLKSSGPLTAPRAWAIGRNELRILRRDPAPLTILVVLPLLLIALLGPAYAKVGLVPRTRGSGGAEQAVPGMAVTFAFALVGAVGFAFFRDHAWRTWDRLRASPATAAELLAGKTIVLLEQAGLQFAVLFGLGVLLFGLHVHGSLLALVLVGAAFSVCLVTIGLALAACCRTIGQVNALTNVGSLIFAGLGGAIVPYSMLPAWARAVAPLDPAYWAMRGYREVIVAGAGVREILPVLASLAGFSTLLLVLAARRFRLEEAKTSWA